MANSPRIQLPYLTSGQANGEVTHNTALNIIDVLLAGKVIDRDLSAPPGGPAQGDAYIVGPSATGLWTGKENNIACWIGTAWVFVVPLEGTSMYLADEDALVIYSGALWSIYGGTDYFGYRQVGTGVLESWYPVGAIGAIATSVVTPAANFLYAIPLVITKRRTVDTIALEVTGADAAKNCRFGLYRSTQGNSNLYPTSKIFDSGDVSIGSTGVKTFSSTQVLEPGLYWAVFVTNGTGAMQFRALSSTAMMPILGLPSTLGSTAQGMGWTVAFTFAALPSSFPGSATRHSALTPLLAIRFSA